jgi:hypothetical protein
MESDKFTAWFDQWVERCRASSPSMAATLESQRDVAEQAWDQAMEAAAKRCLERAASCDTQGLASCALELRWTADLIRQG